MTIGPEVIFVKVWLKAEVWKNADMAHRNSARQYRWWLGIVVILRVVGSSRLCSILRIAAPDFKTFETGRAEHVTSRCRGGMRRKRTDGTPTEQEPIAFH